MLSPSVAGFLYENFGGRPGKTTTFRRSDGSVATLHVAMDRHELAIRSLLEVARDRKSELLRDALLKEGYRVRVFRGRRTVRGERYPEGTMALLPGRNPGDVGRRVREVASEEGARIVEVAGRPFAAVRPVGEGRVIYFADSPTTRVR